MKRILYSRKFWTPLILLTTSLIAILIYNNRTVLIYNWFETLSMTIGIIGLVSTLYNHWKKFNLFVTRLWIIFSNSSAIWNVSANFEGSFSIDEYNKIIEKFRTHDNVTDFYQRSNTVTQITLNGLNYIFEYVELYSPELDNEINCYITDFNSSYDHSIKILERDIIPHFRIIENISKAEDKKFHFKISFKNKNPFIKLIAQNVNEKSINNIWYSMHENTKVGKRDVKITKKSIECTTTDITDFQQSSINYMSLVGD